ncbi:ER degradation-enhancing alpha-mannosidase-like protein 2, partial [Dermatophagoides pteronyssinus]
NIMIILNKTHLFSIGLFLLLQSLEFSQSRLIPFSKNDKIIYKEKILSMFYEAYNSYVDNAIEYDELMPISCSGINTWGTFSLSLIDALDMLAIVDNHTEFRRVAQHIIDTADFETNTNVSVFETNIRVVGGLLSAHLFSRRAGFQIENGWPCSGPLLRLAERVARKLLPAFNTSTGMPYGTINFRYGVPENETPITCTAGVGTYIVEFGTLSRLTGDPIFEEVALNALEALQRHRSKIGLLGNHINVQDGKWTATDAGIGAGVDSYFEYLVKGSILLQMPSLMEVKNDWFIWVSMATGSATMPIFQSLEAFFPGLLTLMGDLDQAKKSLYNYHQVWKQYGFVPEFYDIVNGKHHKREGYPLRPEFIESVYYLYRATKDDHLLTIGADVVNSIYYSARTDCGYATIKSVSDHTIEDRMESFFLAETLKYLFLLFDEDNFINEIGSFGTMIELENIRNFKNKHSCVVGSGGYVFNTEAHPVDISALTCCDRYYGRELDFFEDNVDLYDLFIRKPIKRKEELSFTSDIHSTSENVEYFDVIQTTPTISSSSISTTTQEKHSDEQILLATKTKHQDESSQTELEASFSQEIYWNVNEPESTNSFHTPIYVLKTENETHCSQTTINKNYPFISNDEHLTGVYSAVPSKSSIEIKPDSILINRSTMVIKTININDNKTSDSDQQKFDSHAENEEKIHDHHYGDYELLKCPSQSFFIRLSLYGQMFE